MGMKQVYSNAVVKHARELREKKALTFLEISRKMGVPAGTLREWSQRFKWKRPMRTPLVESPVAAIKDKILTVTKNKPETGMIDVMKSVDATYNEIERAVQELWSEGYDVKLTGKGEIGRTLVPPSGDHAHLFDRVKDSKTIKFGLLGDNQLGNFAARLDVLHTAYEHYAAEGITKVYHTGNMIDGFAKRINFSELLPEAGFTLDSQCSYAAKVYPKKVGITTYFVTGDCHEGWWYKDSGINVGRNMQMQFNELKRADLQYVGHIEADVELRVAGMKAGTKGPILRLMHPGGGTAYALSYKAQKAAEALQGGEKPQIQAIGHYHKFDWNYAREVQNVMTGTTCDQTTFMRKHFIPAHVGYLICEARIGPSDGVLEGLKVEWVPFYDRGFYAKWTR